MTVGNLMSALPHALQHQITLYSNIDHYENNTLDLTDIICSQLNDFRSYVAGRMVLLY